MDFNLLKAGAGASTSRTAKPNWNEGLQILEVTSDNFILSHDLWKRVNIEDKAICTLFFNDAGVFLANISGNEMLDKMADKNILKITNMKLGNLKGARTARRKELLDLWFKNGNALGQFTINEDFVKPEDVEFELVQLTPYIAVSNEMETGNVIDQVLVEEPDRNPEDFDAMSQETIEAVNEDLASMDKVGNSTL